MVCVQSRQLGFWADNGVLSGGIKSVFLGSSTVMAALHDSKIIVSTVGEVTCLINGNESAGRDCVFLSSYCLSLYFSRGGKMLLSQP